MYACSSSQDIQGYPRTSQSTPVIQSNCSKSVQSHIQHPIVSQDFPGHANKKYVEILGGRHLVLGLKFIEMFWDIHVCTYQDKERMKESRGQSVAVLDNNEKYLALIDYMGASCIWRDRGISYTPFQTVPCQQGSTESDCVYTPPYSMPYHARTVLGRQCKLVISQCFMACPSII